MHDPVIRGAVEVVVALFGVLTLIAFVVRRLRLPLSVALVSFALLPGLVFDAAFRLHVDDLMRVGGRTLVLAVPGVLIVAGIVASVLSLATGLSFQSAFIV